MFDFSKKNKVSVWVSQHPYADIPDEYFEETFSRNNTRATNRWSKNFRLKFFMPENMETNGSMDGLIDIRQAAGECSFSESYIPVLMSKARKKDMEQISWIVLVFDCEYSLRQSGIGKDEYLTFLGAFDYDDAAESLFEVEH
ncbi:MAG: immunity 22 family protein [Marinobacterium sp.]|nr:immunity 22 family protein [Marinobacterium sp.]